MATAFLTRLQQTITTALSPPESPVNASTNAFRVGSQTNTPVRERTDGEDSTPTRVGREATPKAVGTITLPISSPSVPSVPLSPPLHFPTHLDARVYAEPDLFSPSDQTITLASSSKIPMTGETGGTDSTPSTATARKFVTEDSKLDTKAAGLEKGEGDEVDKKRKKKRGVNETLVIVRPPPTSGPKKLLNLQIQLVLDVEREKKRDKSRRTSVSSTATGVESLGLPLDIPSTSILNNPTRGLQRELVRHGSTYSTPGHSPPTTPGVPMDSPSGRKTSITITEPKAHSRPGSIRRGMSTDRATREEQLGGIDPEASRANRTASPSSSTDSDKQKRRDRRLSRASSVASVDTMNSNVSGVSGISVTTNGSGIRTNRKGKRIVPMYNLSVHNMMTTTVTDAGTDEKVAKFLKRTVDIHAVGSLEPAEVWHPYALHSPLPHLTPQASRSDGGLPEPEDKSSPSGTVTARHDGTIKQSPVKHEETSLSLSSRLEQHQELQTGTSGGKTKQFFGRLFKKKDTTNESGPKEMTGMISPARNSFVASSAERLLSPLSPTSTRGGVFHAQDSRNTNGTAGALNQNHAAATFGLYPSISDAQDASLGEGSLHRPMGYTWTIKKWATEKGGQEAQHAASSWVARFAHPDKQHAGVVDREQEEVVFEWSRRKGKSGRLSHTDRSRRASALHIAPPIRSNSHQSSGYGDTLEVPSTESSRPTSMISTSDDHHHAVSGHTGSHLQQPLQFGTFSTSPPTNGQIARHSLVERARTEDRLPTSRSPSPVPSLRGSSRLSHHDEGEESDPEDSETPWVCRVFVPRRKEEEILGSVEGKKEKRRREAADGVVVATLYPAPHHPRVIAQVKVSNNRLPISTGMLRTPQHQGAPQHFFGLHAGGTGVTASTLQSPVGHGEEIILTEENIKDVVGVTAMWLVVREDFGGLNKKKKASEMKR